MTPTTREEIARKAKERIWDIKAARILDCQKIQAWIKEEASGQISSRVAAESDDAVKKRRDAARQRYKTLSDELEKLYDTERMRSNENVLKDAEKGLFEEKAPTPSAIVTWLLALMMAGGLELVFFGYMVLYKGAGPALIGLAIILLVGGIFAGHAIASIMTHSQKSEYEETEVTVEKKYIVLLTIGISLIVGVTVLRYVYGGPLAGITAVLFGLAVVTTEAFLNYYRAMRKYYLDKMFRAQQCYAAIQLEKDLKERGNAFDDTWFVHYAQHIDDAIARYKGIGSLSPDASPEKPDTEPAA